LDIFKFVLLTAIFLVVVVLNVSLLAMDEGIYLYSKISAGGWDRTCYYYAPVHILSHEIDLRQTLSRPAPYRVPP
jgi:hypothetical protein